MARLLCLILLASSLLSAQDLSRFPVPDEVVVDLHNPTLKEGVLSTTDGGVISAQGIRIQAQRMNYTRKDGASLVTAEGDLMLEYGDDVFIGEHLDYNFDTHSGLLTCGRSSVGPWFVGGESIRLRPDGSTVLLNAFITTCEDRESEWALRAKRVRIKKNGDINAQVINVRFFDIPVFYLPNFSGNLRTLLDAPISYRADIMGQQGPRVGLRYRMMQWRDLRVYLRAEYFLNSGPAVGIETEYEPCASSTRIHTQSYVARDPRPTQLRDKFRYRFAGSYCGHPLDDPRTRIKATYDFLSDNRMPSDYLADDFNLHTARHTQLEVTHHNDHFISNLFMRVRANTFQTISQELPSLETSFRPRLIGQTGIITTNRTSAGYLDYVFARSTPMPGFHASRIEVHQEAYRPFRISSITLLPSVVFSSIYYSNTPGAAARLLLSGHASLEGNMRLSKIYNHTKHVLEPYAAFTYATNPTYNSNEHFIFSIEDGFSRLSYFRFGLRNFLYLRSRDCCPMARTLNVDLFAYSFVSMPTIVGTIPRIYAKGSFSPTGSLTTHFQTAWNAAHKTWDHFNGRLDITVTEDAAFSLELRYRSAFDYLKADPTSFVVDSARPERAILASQLSERRYTFLTHAFVRFYPTVALEAQTRHGWRRRNQPSYNEAKITLHLLLACRWRLTTYYEILEGEDRWGFTLTLGPGRCIRPVGHTPTVW